MMIEKLKKNPKLQESIAEYTFLKELLLDGVRNDKRIIISRSDFDAFGFDLLAQLQDEGEPVRIQLKAYSGKASVWDIHKSLLTENNGKLIVIHLKEENGDVVFSFYYLPEKMYEIVLSQEPKVPHEKKCCVKKMNLVEIKPNELVSNIFNNVFLSI